MNSGVVMLHQIVSKLLTSNKYRLESLLLRFVLHLLNIINFILYNNWSAQTVNNISGKAMSSSNEPIKLAYLYKWANQSTLNGVHAIEIIKTCTVAFMKAIDSLIVWCREKLFNCKKSEDGKKCFF